MKSADAADPKDYGPPLPRDFYLQNTVEVARGMLNCVLIRISPEGITAGRISETEAYTREDPACHAYRGKTRRNASMFGPPGCAYIYLIYGAYFCFNTVTATEGVAEAVLIRALEPVAGWELMCARRGLLEQGEDFESSFFADNATAEPEKRRIRLGRALCGGPGKLCQALDLTRALDGTDLTDGGPVWITAPSETTARPAPGNILATRRIGITQGIDLLWRFTLRGDVFTSR